MCCAGCETMWKRLRPALPHNDPFATGHAQQWPMIRDGLCPQAMDLHLYDHVARYLLYHSDIKSAVIRWEAE